MAGRLKRPYTFYDFSLRVSDRACGACYRHNDVRITSRHGRSHVGGLVVVRLALFASFLDCIGCSKNFYDPAQRIVCSSHIKSERNGDLSMKYRTHKLANCPSPVVRAPPFD